MKFNSLLGLCLISVASVAILPSCNNDDWKDVDGASPELELVSDLVHTEVGAKFKVAGKIIDNDGISTISLTCPELGVKKVIDIIDIYGEPLKEYDLDYEIPVKGEPQGDHFEVELKVTDIGGRTVTKMLKVATDADFSAPEFTASPDQEITVLIKDKTYFNLRFTVQDNRVIDYITVDVDGVAGYPIRIDGEGKNKIEYANKLLLPSSEAEYKVVICAYDKAAQNDEVRSTTVESKVKVSELPDFEKMYLADVATPDELNSDLFGVPMLIDHVGPFEYEARYYNQNAGTEICFIPQKTDFTPICFAPDSSNPSVFGDDPESVGRLKLDQANVYYLIKFNTKTGDYSTSTYSPAEAIDPVMHLNYGSDDLNTWGGPDNGDIWWNEWFFGPFFGFPDDGDADHDKSIVMRMEQDKNNKHLFTLDGWELIAGETMNFALHNWHPKTWWNWTTWRCDNNVDPEKFMYYGTYLESTSHYEGNDDYFAWKYGDIPGFDKSKWGASEDYRKKYVPDNWCNALVKKGGKYRLVFDAHLERAKLVPAE